jgi:hypothetical protein
MLQQDIYDSRQLLLAQRMEDHNLIDSLEEFEMEMLLQNLGDGVPRDRLSSFPKLVAQVESHYNTMLRKSNVRP